MITVWKVFNFKSIREETELDLCPLTIFAGANSIGESIFIQSVLLIAQTLAHKVGSRSVVLNGALASLGQFDDLKSTGRESDEITITCTCRPLPDQKARISLRSGLALDLSTCYGPRSNRLQEIACEVSFDADASGSERDLFQIQPRLFATRLSCVYRNRITWAGKQTFRSTTQPSPFLRLKDLMKRVKSMIGYVPVWPMRLSWTWSP